MLFCREFEIRSFTLFCANFVLVLIYTLFATLRPAFTVAPQSAKLLFLNPTVLSQTNFDMLIAWEVAFL